MSLISGAGRCLQPLQSRGGGAVHHINQPLSVGALNPSCAWCDRPPLGTYETTLSSVSRSAGQAPEHVPVPFQRCAAAFEVAATAVGVPLPARRRAARGHCVQIHIAAYNARIDAAQTQDDVLRSREFEHQRAAVAVRTLRARPAPPARPQSGGHLVRLGRAWRGCLLRAQTDGLGDVRGRHRLDRCLVACAYPSAPRVAQITINACLSDAGRRKRSAGVQLSPCGL
jgi:hypothetical protein